LENPELAQKKPKTPELEFPIPMLLAWAGTLLESWTPGPFIGPASVVSQSDYDIIL